MIEGGEEVFGAAIESVTSEPEPEPPQPFRTKIESKAEYNFYIEQIHISRPPIINTFSMSGRHALILSTRSQFNA
jgi:hypothetical protein